MSKRNRNRRATPSVSSLPVPVANTTLSPIDSGGPTSVAWDDETSTSAPLIGEPDPRESYAATGADLTHRLISGKVRVRPRNFVLALPVLWMTAVLWMMVQDNGSGNLAGVPGIKALAIKAGIAAVVTVVGGVALKVTAWLVGRGD